MIEAAKTKFSMPYEDVAGQSGLSYRTLMRWKNRLARNRPPVGKPGPKKIRPLDLGALKQEIRELDHGKKRSRGTGGLHRVYAPSISRRDLDAMVAKVRNETNHRKAADACRVIWLHPNLAWAMDGCEKKIRGKLHLHNLTDLCSRYRLPPIASRHMACGEEIAGHLVYLFGQFGPPLFCKRDNGGNLNHSAVNRVLEDAMVIPVNNPPYTASYNGAAEHAQGEFKEYLERWKSKANTIGKALVLSETAAHELNHKPRRCLGGRTACRAYFGGRRLRYPRRMRKSAFRWIRDLAGEISLQAGKTNITPTAWRVASKTWLLENDLIKIVKAGNVSPH
jgi:hypothetical protein